MPVPNQYEPIVIRLAEVSDKLDWDLLLNAEDISAFRTKLETVSISITATKGRIGTTHRMTIHNAKGAEVDAFSVDEGEPLFEFLSMIHETARRKALRIEETISDLSQELDRVSGSD